MPNIVFIESESMKVQGSRNDVYKRYGKNWNIKEHGNGGGNWLLTRPSDVRVDGVSYRSFVLDHYKRCKLTRNLADEFREDVESGKITL